MSTSKTEKPTPKKIRDAAKKGQIFRARDLLTTCLLLIGIEVMLQLVSLKVFTGMLDAVVKQNYTLNYHSYILYCVFTGLKILMPVIALCLVCSVLTGLIQSGMKLASEALKLDFTAVSPLKGLKKIFNLRTLKDFFKTLLYLGTFTLAAIIFWFRYRTIIVRLIYVEPAEMFHLWGRMLHGFLVTMIIAILVILIIDALCEFFLWRKELKMDKKEVEREDREQNGNREIKSRRRQLHEELLTSDMRNDIRQSSVVIANPTHIAVCLYVNKAVTFIPFISVMEKDEKALAVRRYAEKLNIPVVEDVALAREIYRTHSRHSFISMQQLEPVMDILLWLEGVDARWAEIVAANRKKNEGSNSASDSENPPNIQ